MRYKYIQVTRACQHLLIRHKDLDMKIANNTSYVSRIVFVNISDFFITMERQLEFKCFGVVCDRNISKSRLNDSTCSYVIRTWT